MFRDISEYSLPDIRDKLRLSGYFVNKLTIRGSLLLYYTLKDFVFLVDKDLKFKIVTMDTALIRNLYFNNRLINFDINKLEITSIKAVNSNLAKSRFKLYHIIPKGRLDFIGEVNVMKPYPLVSDLEGYKIYTYSEVIRVLSNMQSLVQNNDIILEMTSGSKVRINKGTKLKLYPLTGYIKYNKSKINIFNIVSYSCATLDLRESLKAGVVRFKNSYLTLNSDILIKYYGERYFTLENNITACRKLLSLGNSVDSIIKRFNLPLKHGKTSEIELLNYLDSINNHVSVSKPSIIHARVLTNNLKHKSYYRTIDLDKVSDSDWERVPYSVISLKRYIVSGISKSSGYVSCSISANTKSSAERQGLKELNKLYGDIISNLGVNNTKCKGLKDLTLDETSIKRVFKLNHLPTPSKDVVDSLVCNIYKSYGNFVLSVYKHLK